MNIYFEQQKGITEKWIERCNLKFNNKFDYSKVEITNAATKVTIICPIHNEIQMTKNQHEVSVYGCKFCATDLQHKNKIQERLEIFYKNAAEKFPNIEILSCDYKNNINSPTVTRCKICNTTSKWNNTTNFLGHTIGCRQCIKSKELHRNNDRIVQAINEWKVRCNLKYNNKFDYSKVEEVPSNVKTTIICPIHGEFQMTREDHERFVHGCNQCGNFDDKSVDEKKSEFIKRVETSHNVKVISCDYKTSIDSFTISKCNICETESTWPGIEHLVRSSKGCKNCGKLQINKATYEVRESDTIEWVERCKIKFENKFDYSKVDFTVGADVKQTIICPEHGEFKMSKYNHEHSIYGCIRCSGKSYDTESFINNCKAKYGDLFSYENTNYITSNDFINVTCKHHGKLYLTASSILQYGCPYCTKNRMFSEGYVYVFKLLDVDRWKIGVTKYDVKRRYYNFDQIDESTIRVFKCNHVYEAYKIERQILHTYKEFKNSEDEIIFGRDVGGDSEVLTVDPTETVEKMYEYIINDKIYSNSDLDISLNSLKFEESIKKMNKNICIDRIGHETLNLYMIKSHSIIINLVIPHVKISGVNTHRLANIYCKKYNCKIITVYFSDNIDKSLAVINNALKNNSNILYARNCNISQIPNSEADKFLSEYHLQSSKNASICLGLYYNNELVQVMTFGKPSFNVIPNCVEIYRLCSKADYTIVGGASKLLKYFERNHSEGYETIITYADGSFSSGNVYEELGFEFISKSEGGYFYSHSKTGLKLSRYQATKNKIKSYYEQAINDIKYFDANSTENMLMDKNGFIKITIPSQLKFIKKIKRSK